MGRNVTIVGAGLVGSLWAVLLRQRGYDVTLFERRPDPRLASSDAGRSINLVMTSRGLYGLEKAGLLAEAYKLSVPVYGRMIHTLTSEQIHQPYGLDGECNLSISRIELNKFLLTAAEKAGAKISFSTAVDDIDFKAKTIKLTKSAARSRINTESDQNGEAIEAPYSVLFAADGAGSRVRKKLCEAFPETFQESVDWLEADYKELFLPLGADGKPQLDENALHIWPRGSHMMMALANLDGTFTVTLYLPKKGAVSFEKVTSTEALESLFQSEFSDATALMPDYKKDFFAHPQGGLGTVRCSRWVFDGSVALMGDAAHAIVPFFGQGMNSGFEDCTSLLECLNETSDQWQDALKLYESRQMPNANAIAEMALDNWAEMRDKVGDPRFLLRKKIEAHLEKNFPHLYKSRYGMVTYTLIPYAMALQAGRLQDHVLNELGQNIQTPEQISLDRAEQLLTTHLAPFFKSHRIEIKKYQPRFKV